MPIPVLAISAEEKAKILALQEGHFLELKAIAVRPASLSEFISAFANSDGGELFIGIYESQDRQTRTWAGFHNEEAANAHLQVFEQLFPLGNEFGYEFLKAEGEETLVLHIEISKTRAIVVASDNRAYIRRGAQKLPVRTEEEMTNLRRSKGLVSFESETVAVEAQAVTNSETIIGFMMNVVPNAEPESWLRKQRLLVEGKPTVAGVVLFSDEPQAILPKRTGIKIYRYQTRGEAGRATLAFDPLTIEGDAYSQIHAAVDKTIEIVEEVSKLGEEGFEKIAYPREAIHEIITNAVLHRDYGIADDIHIRVFDNRIEVQSPGRLPAHITPQNILDERFSRNGNIVRLINKYPDPPNKDVGEGLNTAFEAMRKLLLKDPRIDELENSVLVTIPHEPLASPEEIIMQYMETHAEINNSKARELCHIGSENSMKTVLQRLVAKGMLEPIPGRAGRSSAYRKPVD